ncbi:MarR family transcriptional regulator [Ornithinibacillus sp. BX22]|uniref:MarR family transcriptional regulator n=2 Tax=Ornithinibacillus TaxID=484508 RepID=A0A923RLP5_9BACI|nr:MULTISPECIES: MarR family transcriptional regulator [Ornithinibacillus]MBC5638317.1 MarR family transcriptional regulator [Ornithinibacillus hominis]MBS3680903.1 MarR family transcriptional regulator [Ornithinibacillus massiliensis]
MVQKGTNKAIERIEYEITTFIRHAVYKEKTDKKIGFLDRSIYLLLRNLEESGPSRLKTLAERFKLDISTISRQASTAEARGFISRSKDSSDGRGSVFQITPLGRENLLADKEARIERFQNMLQEWSIDEQELFAELLSSLNDSFID